MALSALAGCNQVFDLDPTVGVDPVADVDDDGFPDDSDNCPTIPNDQSNGDHDPFGDACDACPALASASTHDEDRDTVGDECDPCPGIEDFGTDADLDGVGDACDPNVTGAQNRRIAFEPFVTMPVNWQPGAIPWTTSDDTIGPDSQLDISDPGLFTTITTGTGKWATIAGFYSRTRWEVPDHFGLVATGPAPNQKLSCIVSCATSGATCIGVTSVNGNAFASYSIPSRPAMRVAILVSTSGSANCLFEGASSNTTLISMSTNAMAISVVASPRIHASYFEHIE